MFKALDLTMFAHLQTLFFNLSFNLAAGQVLLIEGENGAGKTSLMRCLIGLDEPDDGSVLWQKENIQNNPDFAEQLLYLGHDLAVNLQLTAFENLQFLTHLAEKNTNTITEALAIVGLGDVADLQAQNLSAGQKRRISLARLWLSRAKLWVLDEPFVALDSSMIALLEAKFVEHLSAGGILILTTHQPVNLPHEKVIRLNLTSINDGVIQ